SEVEARSLESREKELSTKLRESKRAGAPKEVLDKLENDLKETTNEKRSAQNVTRRASSEIKTIKEVELNKEITPKDAVEIFKHMTPVEQLDYVKDFLMPFKGRMNSLEDAYMAVLCQAAVGKPNDYVLFTKGTRAYSQNPSLDKNGDGKITKKEGTARPDNKLKGRHGLGGLGQLSPTSILIKNVAQAEEVHPNALSQSRAIFRYTANLRGCTR